MAETQMSSTNSEQAAFDKLDATLQWIQQNMPQVYPTQAKIAEWLDELNNGTGRGRTPDELRDDIVKWYVAPILREQYGWVEEDITAVINGGNEGGLNLSDIKDITVSPSTDAGGGVAVGEGGPNEDKASEGVGGKTDETVSILTSRDMKWYFDDASGKWMVSYKLPNSERRVFFEATGAQLDAIFGEGLRPTSYEMMSFNELASMEGVTFAGDISEVEGTGSFESEVARVVALGLDEGTLPPWAEHDGAVMDILFIATSENKSQEWVIEQLSGLPSFQARFPGINSLTSLGLTIPEAVTGFLEFEAGLRELVLRDGGDPSLVTPTMVGDNLARGHSLEDAEFVFGVFDKMEKNAGALEAFNAVLAHRGQQPLGEDDWFEFMAGNASKELYDIWEEASLARAAADAGLGMSTADAIDLARRTEGLTSYESALEGLSAAASNLLRFRGELELGRYGLDEQDLIDLSLGLAPASGNSQAEIGRAMERAFGAAKAERERQRVNPFTRFSTEGTPGQASLTNLRQEG